MGSTKHIMKDFFKVQDRQVRKANHSCVIFMFIFSFLLQLHQKLRSLLLPPAQEVKITNWATPLDLKSQQPFCLRWSSPNKRSSRKPTLYFFRCPFLNSTSFAPVTAANIARCLTQQNHLACHLSPSQENIPRRY